MLRLLCLVTTVLTIRHACVRGRDVNPYWAFFIKSEGDVSWVRKESTRRVCKVPTWSLQKPAQWEASPISVDSRPSFHRMSSHSRAKIVAGADATLRGKLRECQMKMESMERQFRTNTQRETGRSARALGKIKAKCAADVRAAELVAQADANFWRKLALASERRADVWEQNS